RAASAARARSELRGASATGAPLGDGADVSTMLAVAFPHDQVQILPYNRIVKDLGTLSVDSFMHGVRERFEVAPGGASTAGRGEIAMYVAGTWHTLRARTREPRTREPRTPNPEPR